MYNQIYYSMYIFICNLECLLREQRQRGERPGDVHGPALHRQLGHSLIQVGQDGSLGYTSK